MQGQQKAEVTRMCRLLQISRSGFYATRRRPVRTSGVTQDGVLVVEGLTPGDRIVSAGAAYVTDGASVRIAADS